MRRLVSLALLLALAGLGGVLFFRCELRAPALEAPASLALGRSPRALRVTAADARSGLREVTAAVRQGDVLRELPATRFPGSAWTGGGPTGPTEVEIALDARAFGLREGEAELELAARDWSWASWLRGNRTVAAIPVRVDLTPPRVSVETGLSYVARGGTGAVAYAISEQVVRDGVEVAGAFYPGFRRPEATAAGAAAGGEGAAAGGGGDAPGGAAGAGGGVGPRGAGDSPRAGRRVALYAVARDAPAHPKIQVVAEDAAGNRTAASWPVQFQERRFAEERIELQPRFLEEKVPELAAAVGVEGADLVAVFQEINARTRAENERRVRELATQTGPAPLWTGPFVQWANSEVTSRFAEHRTYFVGAAQVSEAVHYGYDLATLAGAEVPASNAGRVIHAGDLGIYGNCVILDHGLGLASLYGHLASFAVAEGDVVEKGQVLGRSGATGLAGGDHLHFAVLVGGTYVEPKEWWDPKWVREKVESQLGP